MTSLTLVSQQDFNYKRATREQFIGKVEQLEQIIEELSAELLWMHSLLSNPNLNGNQCRVLSAIKTVTTERGKRPDGFVRVYRDDIARRAGVSVGTVSTVLGKFADSGIIAKKIENNPERNRIEREMYLCLPKQTLLNPSGIGLFSSSSEEENEWGGKRVKVCPACKGTDLEEKHYFVCKNEECGSCIHPDQVIEVSELTLSLEEYPLGPETELVTSGIEKPKRPCFHCGLTSWYPAQVDGAWQFLCSGPDCHPNLINSQGRDITDGILLMQRGKILS